MKKLVSLLLAVMMVLALVPAMAADKPIEITITVKTLGNGWPATLEDDFIYQKILEKTGVAWKIVLVDDYFTALNQRIIGNNIPDLMYIESEYQQQYALDDVILNLDPYLDNELAGVMEFLGDTNLIPYQVNGSLYSLPRLYITGTGEGTKSQWALNVRKDWLDKLHLDAPTNIQELYDVAKAFVEQDPDGNNLNDTIGLTGGSGIRGFHIIGMCFDTAFGNYIIERDGKITNSLLQPGMKQALEWAKKFVDDGLMDPDIMTTTGTNKAIAGQVGLHMITWPGMYKQYALDNIAAVNPDAYWIPTGPLHNEMGGEDVMFPYNNVGGGDSIALSADLDDKGNEEKLAAVFKVLNYLTTDEGSYLVMFGIEGEHWNMVDGKPVMTERAAEANYISTYQVFSRIEMPYLQAKFPEAERAFSHSMSVNMFEYYNALVHEPEDMYLADMESYVTTQLAAFIYGDRPIDEYDAFLQELRDNYMFDEYMASATEPLNSYGIGK